MMKNKKRYLYLDCEEARLVPQSLIGQAVPQVVQDFPVGQHGGQRRRV